MTAPKLSFLRVFRYEWAKAVSTRAQQALLAITYLAPVLIAIGVFFLMSSMRELASNWLGIGSIIAIFPTLVFMPFLIVLNTGEWTTRSSITTFTLVPRRGMVLAAKALVGLVHSILFLTLVFTLGALVAAFGTPAEGIQVSWDFTAVHLVQVVTPELISYASAFLLGAAIMNTSAAVVIVLAVPPMLNMGAAFGGKVAEIVGMAHLANTSRNLVADITAAEFWGPFAVSAVLWLVIPAVVGIYRTLRREAA